MTDKRTTAPTVKRTGTLVVCARKGKVHIDWNALRRIQSEGPLYAPVEIMGARRN
ncbi:Uncharacterised protein [uncultured archaeon]|nr:Uncharacterised protein [uncultured archaeon]